MSISQRRMSRSQKKTSDAVMNVLTGKQFTSNAGEIGGNPLSALTDGNESTRWISNVQSPAAVTVDMGAVYTLTQVQTIWAADCTKDFNIQISDDNATWTTLTTGVTSGASGAQAITTSNFSAAARGRYLKINLLSMHNATYGNSLYEVRALGLIDPNSPVGSITSFTASVASTTQVSLSWAYSGGNLSNYIIKRNGTTLATITNQHTKSYTDSTVSIGNSYTYTITGTYAANGSSTNTMTATATVFDPAAARDAFYQPFQSNSPWNLPIVNGVATTDYASLRSASGRFMINRTSWSHGVVESSDADPLVTCIDTNHPTSYVDPAHPLGPTQWRVPTWANPSDGEDAHLEVAYRASDGSVKMLEMFNAARQSNGTITCTRMYINDLKGTGIGPASGVRAYGGSAIGGLIREWEVDTTNPRYTGEIKHALALGIDRYTMLGKNAGAWDGQSWGYYTGGVTDTTRQPGWNAGQPRYGYGCQTGYVWPATEQDGFSMAGNEYNGNIPMGAYFCIPSSVSLSSLGLATSAGMMTAKALQDYGAYVSDAVSNCAALYVEYNSPATKTAAYTSAMGSGWDLNSDLAKVLSALRRVNVNDQNNPNGGPIGATRRAQLLPGVA